MEMEKENKKTIEIPFGAKDSELYKFEYTIPEGYDARIEDGKVIVQKKESEDERIMKMLIEQMERWKKCAEDNNVEQDVKDASDAISYLEKQKEQRPTPKFKIGDVVRDTNHNRQPVYRIVSMDKECYICESDVQSLGDRAVVHFTLDNPYLRLVKQKPAEWSEEDEEWYMYLLGELNASIKDYCGAAEKDIKEAIRWFKSRYKSLRPQPHWKPSKKQIDALNSIILTGSFTYVGQTQDLISLKDELKKL